MDGLCAFRLVFPWPNIILLQSCWKNGKRNHERRTERGATTESNRLKHEWEPEGTDLCKG